MGTDHTSVSTALALSPLAWTWLLETVDPHPAFVDAIIPSCGYYSTFVTRDEHGRPDTFHIVTKTTRNGNLDATFYLAIPLPPAPTPRALFAQPHRRFTALICSQNPAFDLQRFTARFTYPAPASLIPAAPLTLLHHILSHYLVLLHAMRAEVFHATINTEKRTGVGTIDVNLKGTGILESKFGRVGEVEVHSHAMRARSLRIAADFQLRLTEFAADAHRQWDSLRAGATRSIRESGVPGDNETESPLLLERNPSESIQEALTSHLAKVICLVENMKYWQARTTLQTHEVSAINGRTDTKSLKVIAAIQMIYIPFTFVAQIFSTGFFIFPARDVNGLKVDSGIWSMILVGTGFTLVTAMAWLAWTEGSGLMRAVRGVDWVLGLAMKRRQPERKKEIKEDLEMDSGGLPMGPFAPRYPRIEGMGNTISQVGIA